MGKIENIFGRKRFGIDHILQKKGSLNPSVIIRVDGFRYEMSSVKMVDLLRPYGIDFRLEMRNYPHRTADNRPLIDKYVDMKMGKPVNLNHSPNYPNVDIRRLEMLLKSLSEKQKGTERD